jgi:hypothetical protein
MKGNAVKRWMIFFFVVFLLPVISNAEIYKCVDKNGKATFTTGYSPGCTLLQGSVEKKNQPQKKLPHTITKTKPKKKTSRSDGCTTKDGHFACLKEEWLDNMTKFRLSNDFESVKAYIAAKKCLVMKGGLHVTLIDSPGMFGGTASFIYKGVKFWTFREALDYGFK